MNFPQIRMESTPALLGLNIQKSIQQIEQRPADLSIKQPKAELSIETTNGKLSIDQSGAREDVDLKSIARRVEEFADNGYQDWLTGLARIAQQGDDLMMIEYGGNPIADQAKVNSESPMYDFNVGFIPSHFSVKISYEPSHINIKWNTHKPEINVRVNKPIHEYTPGKVQVDMKQWSSLKIDFLGLNIDQKK
jgi:hypothetical protein